MGKVIDIDTNDVIANTKVTIPELNLSTISDQSGAFKFTIYTGTEKDTIRYFNLLASASGYGKHTMVDAGVFSQDIATVTLALKKGNTPTKWFGLVRPEERAKMRAEANINNDALVSASVTTNTYFSQTVPPPYIRVAIRTNDANGKPDENGTIIRTDFVDFDFYVKHVLPGEWGALWATESLKAGAMAVKEFGWYWVNRGGKYPAYGADVDNSTNSQIYNPYFSDSRTDDAVDSVVANGWYQNNAIFESQYCAGSYNNTYSCGTNRMSQNGSRYWADQGKDYQWILNFYYSPTPTYFTVLPRSPKTYVYDAYFNQITLRFSSPGATWYQVNKWANGTWNNIVYFGPNTNFMDTSLNPNQTYYYMVAAWNPGGWSSWSYNNGYIAAVTKSASTPQAPATDAYFITNKEIRLRTTSSDSNVTAYYVLKWNGSSWTNVYYGSSNEYADTGLSSNSGYSYSVAVYDPYYGWSDFSNFNGFLRANTYQTF